MRWELRYSSSPLLDSLHLVLIRRYHMVSQRRWYQRLMLLLALMLAAGTVALATVPNPPSPLRLSVESLVFGQPARVHLLWPSWDHQPPAPTAYIVYRASATDSTAFDSIAVVPPNDVNDSGPTMQQYVDEVGAGDFWYYIKAA